MRLKCSWSQPSFEDVKSACRWSRYWREKCDVDQALEMLLILPLVTILARELRFIIFFDVDPALEMLAWEMRVNYFFVDHGDVATFASHDIGAKNAIEFFFFWRRPSFGDVARVAGHDIGARNAIEFFLCRPSFGDVASVASHDIGARNAIDFFEGDQTLEMMRVSPVTILAREMRLKFLKSTKLWRRWECPLVTILEGENRLKIFEADQALEVVPVP